MFDVLRGSASFNQRLVKRKEDKRIFKYFYTERYHKIKINYDNLRTLKKWKYFIRPFLINKKENLFLKRLVFLKETKSLIIFKRHTFDLEKDMLFGGCKKQQRDI